MYATCDWFPHGDEDFAAVSAALGGIGCDAIPWTAPAAAWERYDLVVIRSTWDYASRVDDFLAWAHSMSRLANNVDIVEWNHDKRYLAALYAAGVPVVATTFDPSELRPGRWVAKPTISNGARDTMAGDADEALAHVRALHAAGRRAMVQPYLDAIDDRGETALVYIGGGLSHAVRKGAVIGRLRREDGTYEPDQVAPKTPTLAELEVADAVLDAIPFDRTSLLYARVDLVPDGHGDPVLLELELIEPALFLSHAPGAAERLADAIAAML